MNAATMHDVLRERAQLQSDTPAVSFLSFAGEAQDIVTLTYGALDERVRAIAAHLSRTLLPGDRALLLYPPGLAFVEAFFACLYAGVIAVPLALPRSRTHTRVAGIARDAGARLLLCGSGQTDRLAQTLDLSLEILATDLVDTADAQAFHAPRLGADAIAFLQYTSGSTGEPKGVVVSHQSLLSNLAQIREAFGNDSSSICVNWLPHHHDMGLIGTLLQPIYAGFPTILMSPLAFVQRPERWLAAISRFGGTTCGGPNFGYRHCVERIAPESRESFDLRSWRLAFCGAEPIQADTMHDFAAAFASQGFRRSSLYPCYGLAEAILFVTGAQTGNGAIVQSFDADALEAGHAAPTGDAGPKQRVLVSCGEPHRATEVVIADSNGMPLAPGCIGEVRVRGAGIASGYWRRPELSRKVFEETVATQDGDPFLRTGDLGFFEQGQLFVTGRIKDLIIVDGRNVMPQDLEWTAQDTDVAVNAAAAFSMTIDNREQIGMLIEVSPRHAVDAAEQIGGAVLRAVTERHEVALAGLVLVRPATIPRTTSGKLIRARCRHVFQEPGAAVLGAWSPRGGWQRRTED